MSTRREGLIDEPVRLGRQPVAELLMELEQAGRQFNS